ncbi:MAG: hypothetical protein IJC51_04925 [Eggerthellaceae bacterium]|nr:hypothetical protein [Eggerthellaceae bacterium]
MPLENDLAPEAREEIDRQAARIAELGDEWQPTSQNLQAVVAAVLKAQKDSWRDSQAKGIESARRRGVSIGRPRLAMPKGFEEVYGQWKSRELSGKEAAKRLGVSRATFGGWVKEWRLLYEAEGPSDDLQNKAGVFIELLLGVQFTTKQRLGV